MDNELTYILGAGASFQSIPVVKSFSNRFFLFMLYLRNIFTDNGFGDLKQNAFKLTYEKAEKIHKAFSTHQSFDTYFKKLFHTNELEKITEAKKILTLYFTWEHLSNPTGEPEMKNETIFWKQSMIDKRYDALIAGLLKPTSGKSDPYCPINFITWNYDLNLFVSLKNYFNPNGTFGEFLTKIDKKNNVWQVGDKISIINMNGYFYCSDFSNFQNIESLSSLKKEIHDILYEKIKNSYFSPGYIDSDAELIKFAWEYGLKSSGDSVEVAKIASKKIFLSNNIVVIGYTFPLYNRLVDFGFFNGTTLSKKTIYIQDPNANRLANSIISDFNIDISTSLGSTVKEESSCDSFLIPSSIYKYRNSLSDI